MLARRRLLHPRWAKRVHTRRQIGHETFHHFDELVAVHACHPLQLGRYAGEDLLELMGKAQALCSQPNFFDPAVGGRCPPLDEVRGLEMIDKRSDVGSVASERLGDVAHAHRPVGKQLDRVTVRRVEAVPA